MTKVEWYSIAKGLKALWSFEHFLPKIEVVDIWYETLKDLTRDDVIKAIRIHMSESRYAPMPADIRRLAASGSVEDIDRNSWEQSWNAVIRAISRYGYMREKEALDSLPDAARYAVQCLGWQNICRMDIEQEMAWRKDFKGICETYQARQKRNAVLPDSMKIPLPQIRKGNEETAQIEMIRSQFICDSSGSGSSSYSREDIRRKIDDALLVGR